MKLNDCTRMLLTVAIVVLLVYLLNGSNFEALSNEGALGDDSSSEVSTDAQNNLPANEQDNESDVSSDINSEPVGVSGDNVNYENPESNESVESKFETPNQSVPSGDDWQQDFDSGNNVMGSSGDDGNFSPMDGGSDSFANFTSNGEGSANLFDADNYLPQEKNNDWFEVQEEPISVKNRHLINVTKPIGINTIGSSRRNATYDIRGTVANPKFTVSPWMQSSIEPDHNLKSFCN